MSDVFGTEPLSEADPGYGDSAADAAPQQHKQSQYGGDELAV